MTIHDNVIKWKHFLCYWTFVRGIHRSPVNSPHQGQWHRALMFSFIFVRLNSSDNNGEAGDLRLLRAHYDVIVMTFIEILITPLRLVIDGFLLFLCNGHSPYIAFQRTLYFRLRSNWQDCRRHLYDNMDYFMNYIKKNKRCKSSVIYKKALHLVMYMSSALDARTWRKEYRNNIVKLKNSLNRCALYLIWYKIGFVTNIYWWKCRK